MKLGIKILCWISIAAVLLGIGAWLGRGRAERPADDAPSQSFSVSLGPSHSNNTAKRRVREVVPEGSLMQWDILSRTNPDEAFRKYAEMANLKSPEAKRVLEVILDGVQKGPEEIWDICLSLKNDPAANMVAYSLARIWAERDPLRFVKLASAMSPGTRNMLGGAFAAGLSKSDQGVASQSIPLIEQLLDDNGRGVLGSNLTTSFKQQFEDWPSVLAESLAHVKSEATWRAAVQTGINAAVNPIEFALKMPSGKMQSELLLPLVASEVHRRAVATPDFVGNWLNSCPQGAVRDHAVAAYSKAVHLVDPDAAATWAKEIMDVKLRASILAEIDRE